MLTVSVKCYKALRRRFRKVQNSVQHLIPLFLQTTTFISFDSARILKSESFRVFAIIDEIAF